MLYNKIRGHGRPIDRDGWCNEKQQMPMYTEPSVNKRSGVPPQQMSKITRRPSASASASPSLRWGLVKQTKKPLTMLFSALVTIVFGPCFLQIQRIPIRGLLKNPASLIKMCIFSGFSTLLASFPKQSHLHGRFRRKAFGTIQHQCKGTPPQKPPAEQAKQLKTSHGGTH